jgi:hypothetical protein
MEFSFHRFKVKIIKNNALILIKLGTIRISPTPKVESKTQNQYVRGLEFELIMTTLHIVTMHLNLLHILKDTIGSPPCPTFDITQRMCN